MLPALPPTFWEYVAVIGASMISPICIGILAFTVERNRLSNRNVTND